MARTAQDSISRLPEVARDEISRAIEDGRTAKQVAAICERYGLKGVQSQNVTNYKQGKKHKEWKAKQDRIAAIRRDNAEGREIFEAALADGMSPADAACALSSLQLMRALRGINVADIEAAAADNPKLYIQIVRAATEMARVFKPEKKAKAETEAAAQTAPKGGGLSEEQQRRAIIDQVDKAMGIKK